MQRVQRHLFIQLYIALGLHGWGWAFDLLHIPRITPDSRPAPGVSGLGNLAFAIRVYALILDLGLGYSKRII